MKGRWIPFLATTAALALAAVAPAQDRGRRSGGGGSERSSPSRSGGGSPSRGGGESRPSRSEPKRSEPTRSEPSRPSRSGGDERPSRSRGEETRPSRSGGDERPSRTSDPGSRDRRPSSPPSTGGDNRPSGGGSQPGGQPSGGDTRPSRSGDNGGRRDPFERSRDRTSSGGNDDRSRPDRGSNGGILPGDRGGSPGRTRPSRSGTVSYGTRSNGFGSARPVRYGSGMGRVGLSEQIRRTGARTGYNVSYGGTFGGLRVGYVGYNNYWRDDNFCYPFYVFNPWTPNVYCVASPWYRYSYMPGYINTTRVIVVNNYVTSWGSPGWNDYDYRSYQSDRRQEAVGDTLSDIRDAFERNSARYGERLLPQTGQVAIFNDGKYDYSLSADDFQDMFLDGVEQSKTSKYEIIESRTRGDELQVRARHEYVDSWGANQVVFHSYTLRRERDGRFVIREFGTD